MSPAPEDGRTVAPPLRDCTSNPAAQPAAPPNCCLQLKLHSLADERGGKKHHRAAAQGIHVHKSLTTKGLSDGCAKEASQQAAMQAMWVWY